VQGAVWRLVITPALPGAENMAIDHALLEGVQRGGRPVVRFYTWSPACLSLGRNQPVAEPARVAAAAAARGAEVVRRPTGGFAVFHDRELTYAVVVPVGVLGSPRESYVAINRALVAGLRLAGVGAEVVGAGRAAGAARGAGGAAGAAGEALRAGTAWEAGAAGAVGVAADAAGGGAGAAGVVRGVGWDLPCFRAAVPGEVVVGGRKLVGSAQRCERRVLLQHGSILLDGGQDVVAELLGAGVASRAPASGGHLDGAEFTTLAAVLGGIPELTSLVSALTAGFEAEAGIRLAPSSLTSEESERASALTALYRSDDWTWRT
jgi:lipoate-protein ligase A